MTILAAAMCGWWTMRLDDLVVLNPNIEGDYRHPTRAEVLQAALTEPCPVCEGRGWDWKRCADEDLQVDDPVDEYWCRTCEGRGRLPIDGVWLGKDWTAMVVPLSMLEGDDT